MAKPTPLTAAERRKLIEKPFPIVYIPPTKRWGGVQLMNDETWMREAGAWNHRYRADEGDE